MSSVDLFRKRLLALSSEREPERIFYATPTPAAPSDDSPPFPHITDCHEFGLVTAGQAIIRMRDGAYRLTRNDLLLLAPRVEHAEEAGRRGQGYTMFWCAVEGNWSRLGETRYSPKTGWRGGPGLKIFGRTDVGNIAVAIAAELHHREEGWHQCVQGLLRYLSCILLRRLQRGQPKDLRPQESPTINGDPRACRLVQTALQFCEEHHWGRVGLHDVAAAVGYSPSYVSRLFASQLGCSVSEHLRELRMESAKSMLERSEAPIAEIGRWLGYKDPSNFTHAFTRAVGLPPKSYREHLRGL